MLIGYRSLLLGILLLSLVGCRPPAGEVTLTVFAAASLTEAFQELGARFEADNPGVTVSFNFAGSQQLAQQLAQGAPADLFASANTAQMTNAVQTGRIAPETIQPFVSNRLVVIYPQDNPAGVQTLADLAQPGLQLVLAAPAVPVGQYSLTFLDQAAQSETAGGTPYRQAVLANVVSYEENVRAVLAKVILGEADAGIVYTNDIQPPAAASVGQIDIPDELNVVALYPIAPVQDSAHPAEARVFIDLILSPGGQAVLARYGFQPVQP